MNVAGRSTGWSARPSAYKSKRSSGAGPATGRSPTTPVGLVSSNREAQLTAAAVAFTAAVAPTWPAVGPVCALPSATVALERVQSGAHYPTDVAAGAVIGLAGAWLTRHAPRLILRLR
ncbi:phosphatase PAP2 family protein [Streptomyces sp. NPDC001796]|uniref:phosphatase PAP2 family protein n=1 Tax=Streptomyces sp. NPDC001796 TaxID=3364609 RepID=UPI0036A358EC